VLNTACRSVATAAAALETWRRLLDSNADSTHAEYNDRWPHVVRELPTAETSAGGGGQTRTGAGGDGDMCVIDVSD